MSIYGSINIIVRGPFINSNGYNLKRNRCGWQVDRMDLVGSVEDSDVIIVDDMIDTAGTLCKAASVLKEFGGEAILQYSTRFTYISATDQLHQRQRRNKRTARRNVPLDRP